MDLGSYSSSIDSGVCLCMVVYGMSSGSCVCLSTILIFGIWVTCKTKFGCAWFILSVSIMRSVCVVAFLYAGPVGLDLICLRTGCD